MELVYLWVKEYNNIEDVGFNFSPRFKCEFDENTNELTIKKEDYVSIFPKGINFTVIVGKNGSGKSNILEYLIRSDWINDGKAIVLFKNGNRFVSNRDNLKYLKNGQEIIVEKIDKVYSELFYMNSDIYQERSIKKGFTENLHEGGSFYQNTLLRLFSNNKTKNGSMVYDLRVLENHICLSLLNIYPLKKFLFDFIPSKIILEKLNSDSLESKESEFLNDLFGTSNSIELSIEELLRKYYNTDSQKELFYNLCSNIDKGEDKKNKEKNINLKLFDKNDINFFDLSYGEKRLVMEFTIMYEWIKSKSGKCTILLDEPDVTWHPDWQKRYINELVNAIRDIDLNQNIHFIITTHSPFLLSDMPEKNIIYLEKDKDTGQCINITKDLDIHSFGANIHTLLSDGFFISNGLMGEFAKVRINEVINYLNPKAEESEIKSDEEAKNIIDIIGEPVLKNTLLTMYDDKVYKDESKLAKLERKKEELQKEINELTGKSDEKS